MITALRPYPAMKDSGVPWLGQVPEHWELAPNRRLLRQRKVLVGSRHTQYELLSLTKKGVIVRDVETGRGKFSADMGTSQEVRAGDLVFCLFDVPETPRTVGLSRHTGMITGAYTVFECRDALLAAYLDLYYRAMDDRKLLSPLYSGLRNTIPPDHFLAAKSPLPSPAEQAAIVRFLDYYDRRIRRYIRAKQKLIKLLEEEKQAIIHRAVTGQIDVRTGKPYPRYKPSGVEWLGDVPEGWEVAALRLRYDQCLGKMLDAKRITGDHLVPYLRNTDVQWGRINTVSLPQMDIEAHELSRFTVQPGDLLVCEGGDVGRCAFWTGQLETCGFQKALHRLRPLQPARDYPRFLYYLMFLASKLGVFVASGSESTIAHLTGDKLRAHRFVFSPRAEQEAIAKHLDVAVQSIESTIAAITREISLLREYRTRLIADVVTGKLDVREAAAALPDEPEEADEPEQDAGLDEGEDDLASDDGSEQEADEVCPVPGVSSH